MLNRVAFWRRRCRADGWLCGFDVIDPIAQLRVLFSQLRVAALERNRCMTPSSVAAFAG